MKRLFLLLALIPLVTSCTVWRGILYGSSDIDDHRKIFTQASICKGDSIFRFAENYSQWLDTIKLVRRVENGDSLFSTLNAFLNANTTISFLIIRNDTVLFEKYCKGYDRAATSTLFSVSKSLTSLLCGIAMDEGFIKSIDDPVTEYIPELKKKDPMFQKLTVRHLLDMRSGIKYDELYNWKLFTGITRLYYGSNQMQQIKGLKFKYEPGAVHKYQSISTSILGVVIERATGEKLPAYMEEKVWKPLGMEYNASWSLDDRKHRLAKAAVGFSTNAADLAKIGRLYLSKGNWNGKRIVDSAWIEKSATPQAKNDGYQNCWYSLGQNILTADGKYQFSDSLSAANRAKELNIPEDKYIITHEKGKNKTASLDYWNATTFTNSFYAMGIFGQILYINPDKNIIMVRLGKDKDIFYPILMNQLSKLL